MRRLWILGLTACVAAGLLAPGALAFTKESLVWKKCASCHEPAGGKIPRVEDIRATPEEWTVIVDRMSRLHGMDLGKGEMDGLLKELCSTQILTPEEAAKVSYLSLYHNTQHQEAPDGADEERLFATCVRCHSAGKILSYRMTPDAWAKVRDLHLYVDPAVIFQMREMHWIEEADAVLQYLAKAYPYGEAWKAPAPKLTGSWLVLGREPGKGTYHGTAEIKPLGNGEFSVSGALAFSDGTSETFGGEATLYGGYALRTRTRHNGHETLGAYSLVGGVITGEHHFPAPDFRTSTSTWHPLGSETKVLRVSPSFLLTGQETDVWIDGTNLPEAADVKIGSAAVQVVSTKRLSPTLVVARVLSRSPSLQEAKVSLNGAEVGSLTLAPRVDYIAVTPAIGRARLDGGPNYPAEGVQFEAIAYSDKGTPTDPADDLALGPVPASFRLEEEKTRDNDDDLAWVGAIDADGTYLPTGDYGPVAAREYSGEASGWVKVVAEYKGSDKPLTGEAKLAVTVPDYIQRIR